MNATGNDRGDRLRRAVEAILDPPDAILQRVEFTRRLLPRIADPRRARDALCDRIIREHATRAAITGGATALPAVVPGPGTLAALAGGALADTAYLIKLAVEMALALAHVHGLDIRQERDRQLGFLLGVEQVRRAGGAPQPKDAPAFVDVARTFAPHQVRRLITAACSRIAIASLGKGLARVIPLLGVALSAALNRELLLRAGRQARQELERREELMDLLDGAPENVIDVTHDRDHES